MSAPASGKYSLPLRFKVLFCVEPFRGAVELLAGSGLRVVGAHGQFAEALHGGRGLRGEFGIGVTVENPLVLNSGLRLFTEGLIGQCKGKVAIRLGQEFVIGVEDIEGLLRSLRFALVQKYTGMQQANLARQWRRGDGGMSIGSQT